MTDNTLRPTNKVQSYRCQYGYKSRDGGERVCGRKAKYMRKGKGGTFLKYCEKHREVAQGGKPENFEPDPHSEVITL